MIRDTVEGLFSAAALPDSREMTELLIQKYHALDGILCADPLILTDLIGERATMLIKLAAAMTSRRAENRLESGGRLDESELRHCLSRLFCGISVERLHLISLDSSDEIIAIDCIGEGSVNSANVTPRRLLDVAVRRGAKSVIIAHNHPAGVPKPSAADFRFTLSAESILTNIGVKLKAHYIVAGNKCKEIERSET